MKTKLQIFCLFFFAAITSYSQFIDFFSPYGDDYDITGPNGYYFYSADENASFDLTEFGEYVVYVGGPDVEWSVNPGSYILTGVADGIGSGGTFQLNEATPVELTSFTVKTTEIGVELSWQTATEVNNYGFDIERKSLESGEWNKIDFVVGAGNSNSPKEYSFVDNSKLDGTYQYRLKQIDIDGNYDYSDIVSVEISRGESLPEEFVLHQNYPNPFNPETIISYQLANNSKVQLKVFDLLGTEVATLVNKYQAAGNYNINFDACELSSGIYIYRITTGNFIQSRKMILLK